MSDGTSIEWTDATWNVITGCSVVSAGCKNCYAMKLAGTRLQHHGSRVGLTQPSAAGPVWTGEVRFNHQWLHQPLEWTRPRQIFVCAHGDLFHESVLDEWIDQVFAAMALAPQHTFQVLTKRAARMRAYLTHDGGFGRWGYIDHRARQIYRERSGKEFPPGKILIGPLPHVWLGVSVEDQAAADGRIPELLATPAAVRWISAEPLLGPINSLWKYLERHCDRHPGPLDSDGRCEVCEGRGIWNTGVELAANDKAAIAPGLDWVVTGGESGRNARPMHPDWARSLRDQCAAAAVPFHFKQWGEWAPDEGPRTDGSDPIFEGKGPCAKLVGDEWHLAKNGFTMPVGTDGNEWLYRLGKRAAGRLLDGVQHDGFPR